jgi:hypothetical protein
LHDRYDACQRRSRSTQWEMHDSLLRYPSTPSSLIARMGVLTPTAVPDWPARGRNCHTYPSFASLEVKALISESTNVSAYPATTSRHDWL